MAYTYTTIDAPGATSTYIYDINNQGAAAGPYNDATGHTHGFVYDHGVLGTIDVPGASDTAVTTINDNGQVAGNPPFVVYDNGAFTPINVRGFVWAINNNGEVVGNTNGYAFIYNHGAFTTIFAPGSSETDADGINNDGVVAGSYYPNNSNLVHGFVYDHGALTTFDPPGALWTFADAINDLDVVTGYYFPGTGSEHGFVYDNGAFTDIDVQGAYTRTTPDAINDLGVIAGFYDDATGHTHGFVYDHGVYTIINVPGATSTHISTINNQGEIAGWYSDDAGKDHAFFAKESGGNPPTITSNGGGDSASVSVPENSTAVTTVTAQDPDGQALTFSIDGGDDASKFTMGLTTGKLAFLTAPDFEVPTDTSLDGSNSYHVNVRVTGAAGGSDTQAITVAVKNVLGETWAGGNGGEAHTGTGEEDNLTGGNGKDIIGGGGGNDIINGGNGADTLIGGAGDDTLTGGNGPDLFVFATGFGKDIITDFKPMVDAIQFNSAVFPNFAAVQSHIADNGAGSAVITASGSDTITLEGVSLAQLGASDFTFV